MSKFWQKKYISKYTGAEIDAAVAKADTVPAVTAYDAGKALVVNDEGKIVAGEAGGSLPVITLPEFPAQVGAQIALFLTAASTTYTSKIFHISDEEGAFYNAFANLKKGDIFTLRPNDQSSPDMVGICSSKDDPAYLINASFALGNISSGVLVKIDFDIHGDDTSVDLIIGTLASTPGT